MSKQERKVVKGLTLPNLTEVFCFIQDNIDAGEKDRISKVAILITAAKEELQKEHAVQDINVLLQPIRDITAFGAGFGFGPHNKALGYLGDCIEQKTDIDFSHLYDMFDKPKVGSVRLWMSPEGRYAAAVNTTRLPSPVEEKDPGFNFS